jgi:hypothetical protein
MVLSGLAAGLALFWLDRYATLISIRRDQVPM